MFTYKFQISTILNQLCSINLVVPQIYQDIFENLTDIQKKYNAIYNVSCCSFNHAYYHFQDLLKMYWIYT